MICSGVAPAAARSCGGACRATRRMSPWSRASVSSHGGTPPASPRNGSTSSTPEAGALAERARRACPSTPTSRCGSSPSHSARRSVAARSSRRPGGRHLLVDPPGQLAARAGVDDHAAAGLHRVGQRLGDAPARPHQHERRRGQRVGQVVDQRGHLGGLGEHLDVAADDDPPVGEERRGLRRVDQRDDRRVGRVGRARSGRGRPPRRRGPGRGRRSAPGRPGARRRAAAPRRRP